jgi:hypothetical protein
MRKQGIVLKHHADVPLVDRYATNEAVFDENITL